MTGPTDENKGLDLEEDFEELLGDKKDSKSKKKLRNASAADEKSPVKRLKKGNPGRVEESANVIGTKSRKTSYYEAATVEETQRRNIFGTRKKETSVVENHVTGTQTVAETKTRLGRNAGQIYTVDKDDKMHLKGKSRGMNILWGARATTVSSNYDDGGKLQEEMAFRKTNLLSGMFRRERSHLDKADQDGIMSSKGHRQRLTLGWGLHRGQEDQSGNVTRSAYRGLGGWLYTIKETKMTINPDGGYFKDRDVQLFGGLLKKRSSESAMSDDGPTIKTSSSNIVGKKGVTIHRADDASAAGELYERKVFGKVRKRITTEESHDTLGEQRNRKNAAQILLGNAIDIYGNSMADEVLLGRANGPRQSQEVGAHFSQNIGDVMAKAKQQAIGQRARATP